MPAIDHAIIILWFFAVYCWEAFSQAETFYPCWRDTYPNIKYPKKSYVSTKNASFKGYLKDFGASFQWCSTSIGTFRLVVSEAICVICQLKISKAVTAAVALAARHTDGSTSAGTSWPGNWSSDRIYEQNRYIYVHIHTYIPTYVRTYIHTYHTIPYHNIT